METCHTENKKFEKFIERLKQLLGMANRTVLVQINSMDAIKHHLDPDNGLQHDAYHRLIKCCKQKFMYDSRLKEVEYKVESDNRVF